MERKDKILSSMKKDFKSGDIVKTNDIITTVRKYYPEIGKDCVCPSDFCKNHKNDDPFSGKYHVFVKVGYAKYRVI